MVRVQPRELIRVPDGEPELLAPLDDGALLTHGICPACFDRYAPDLAYPR